MEEFSDIRNYAATSMVRDVMLFGQAPEVAAQSPMLKVMANGFLQSIDMVAHELGWTLDAKKRTQHEMSVATRPIESPVGVIEAGTVAAQRFTWQGTVDGEPVITVRTNWMMDDGNLADGWRLGEQRFEVEFDAEPPLVGHVPRSAPAGPRRGLVDRVDRTGDALRERDPLRRERRARDQDLSRSARSSPGAPLDADRGPVHSSSTGIVNAGASDATVDLEDLPGDPARCVRDEEQHRRRDVLGLTDPVHRRVRLELRRAPPGR